MPVRFRAFAILCGSQLLSLFGSHVCHFALGIWVYRTTQSATLFAFMTLAMQLPAILVSPLAGALVDRWDRRWPLILSDAGDAAAVVVIASLLWLDHLEHWHLYLILATVSLVNALQPPAFAAATTLLVPKSQLGRANGMVQATLSLALIAAPLAAGLLLERIGLLGLLAIDLASALVAIAILLALHVPRPETGPAAGARPLLREAAMGWTVIRSRPGLLGLLLLLAAVNFSLASVNLLLTPLVLSFASAAELGVVLTSASCGMLAGGVLMSLWRGPQRRVDAIFGLLLLQGLVLIAGLSRQSASLLAAAAFGFMILTAMSSACSQTIWQSKVEPALQGRVFAIRSLTGNVCVVLALAVTGPLADHVFEPLMRAGGPLARSAGRLLGVGPGRGIALLLISVELLLLVALAVGFQHPRLRRLEEEIPDALADALG